MLNGCSPIAVSTVVAPEARFGDLRTFSVLNAPRRRTGQPSSPNDPMVNNSITNRALRQDLAQALTARGYSSDRASPDFTVAYYASLRGRLDVGLWDYGYPGRWGGWRERPEYVAEPYTEGTVIVDVVNPKTHELIWRGRGVSDVSDDPETYAQNLDRTIREILKTFPARQPA